MGSTSALLFGSAIDKACEDYAINKNQSRARHFFREEWKKIQEGFEEEDGSISKVSFHPLDFDHELLIQSDNEFILKDTLYETVAALVKAGTEKERINYANWISMHRKGIMLVNKFIEWVDENVETILETQSEIELEDEDGNKVTGKPDLVIKIHGYDKPLLVDLKTSARYYERGSVKQSEQLALYYMYLKATRYPDMERAAFLVLNKTIKKNRTKTCRKCGNVTTGREKTCAIGTGKARCHGEFDEVITPEVNLQYIHDEISQEFIDATVEKYNIVKDAIIAKKFEMNLNGCANYYGRPCPYAKFCENGCMDGLIKKEQK